MGALAALHFTPRSTSRNSGVALVVLPALRAGRFALACDQLRHVEVGRLATVRADGAERQAVGRRCTARAAHIVAINRSNSASIHARRHASQPHSPSHTAGHLGVQVHGWPS
jgi:hypothetical protein